MSLTSQLDADCLRALELAKTWLPEGQRLDPETLLRALYHATPLKDQDGLKDLGEFLPAPAAPGRQEAGKVPVDEALKKILQDLQGPVTPPRLFAALARCPAFVRRVPQDRLQNALRQAGIEVPPAPPRLPQPEALREFGRVLTDPATEPPKAPPGREQPLQTLMLHLLTPRFRNVVLVGPPGVGKTSLVAALARKLRARDASLPAPLADLHLVALSPSFPRSAAGTAEPTGGYDTQRIRAFFRAVEANPGVLLYIDQFFAFLGLLHRASIHQELFDTFRNMLDSGVVSCIGALHPQELPRLADIDPSLARRFRVLHVTAPTGPELVAIVEERRAGMEAHFRLSVPDALVPRAIALADQHLRERSDPERSLRLLESACARAALAREATVSEPHLLQALEDFVGPVILPGRPLSAAEIEQKLKAVIVGQDAVLSKLATAVTAGRIDRGWFLRAGPRGVFLFGGPTGVGKTETAMTLARMLGNGREALVRVDCQNFQGSGSGWEANTLTWRLLGVAPGYMGHVPGCRDGLLVRVRDFPECVLLFDEFEKADAVVGRLLLRILDEGKAQDSEGNELDFRRCFVVLTSNAGVTYQHGDRFGFPTKDNGAGAIPTVTQEDLDRDLRGTGLGQEFLARVQQVFLFQGLGQAAIEEILNRQLAQLRDLVRARGKDLVYSQSLIQHLTQQAARKPNLGVRYLLSLVRGTILDALNAALQAGEVDDTVGSIELLPPEREAGGARRRDGNRLVVVVSAG
jgi:ATP-dependent Clp protease ATP-binding subunit ClpA